MAWMVRWGVVIQWPRSGALRKRASVPVLLAAVLFAGAYASVARADGDPASDYLVGRQVFLSAGATTESPAQRQLIALVQAANRAGFPIRVATVPTEYDLGSIIELWRKPQLYARFLGLELPYKGRLLVAMPNGFGFSWPGHSPAAEYRLLGRLRVGVGSASLPVATQAAVRQLAGADGIRLASATGQPAAGKAGAQSDTGLWIAIALAALAMLAALATFLRMRSRRRRAAMPVAPAPTQAAPVAPSPSAVPPLAAAPSAAVPPAAAPTTAKPRLLPIPLRWALPSFAFLAAVAIVTPIVAASRSHPGGVSNVASSAVQTPPPFTWPVGSRAAPEFALRDQSGQRVSVAAYHGRPVIITFIDPLCRNLCPLEAKVLNQVVAQMPPAQRPVILAVSVDVYANTRADLLQDVRKWELVPQWRWAVGRPAQLAAVWKRYEIGVNVVTKKLAGTAINYITHTEAAYIVDRTGHERALFLWPFYPQDVERMLRELS